MPLEQQVRGLLNSAQGTMVADEGLTMVIPLPAGVQELMCTFAWLLPGGVLKEHTDAVKSPLSVITLVTNSLST